MNYNFLLKNSVLTDKKLRSTLIMTDRINVQRLLSGSVYVYTHIHIIIFLMYDQA